MESEVAHMAAPVRTPGMMWRPPSVTDIDEALIASCGAVGGLSSDAAVWPSLVPLLHELADALDDRPRQRWPDSEVVACRRLAHAVRAWRLRHRVSGVDGELVLAIASLIEVVIDTGSPASTIADVED